MSNFNLNDLLKDPPPPPEGERGSEPKMYRVWAVDDPETPMEFAKTLYQSIFNVNGEEILKTLHETGKALLGEYTFDIAETKARQAVIKSGRAGYNMNFAIQPVEQNRNEDGPENLTDPV